MSLLTRCTRCNTLFRVTPVQLQARGGKVRCGRCMNVFDGFQALAVEQEDAVSEPVRFEPEAPATPGSTALPDAISTPLPTLSPEFADGAGRRVASEIPPVPDIPEEDVRVTLQSVAVTAAAPKPPVEAAPPRRFRLPRPNAWPRPDAWPRPSATVVWAVACALAVLVLAMQLIYAARGELAARMPVAKVVFSGVCARLGCSLALPQDPTLVKIEASDVRMVDASRPQLVQLTATLRSYASYYLAYPALDLVLTNANEHALARRVFVPQEYLGRNRDPDAGLPPHAEITIALDVDTGNANAAGFRLDLMAAP